MLDTVAKRKHTWLGQALRHESLLHDMIEGRMTERLQEVGKNVPDERTDEKNVCGTQNNSLR